MCVALRDIPYLTMLKAKHIDDHLQVTDRVAIEMARRLAREKGIFAGYSSGANVSAAVQLLRGSFGGKTVAVLINDPWLKYLSTDLWQ